MGRSLMSRVAKGLVLMAFVSGCLSPRPFQEGPDLTPLRPLSVSGPDGFCHLSGSRAAPQLGVSVQNIGDSESPASITTIEFFPGGSVQLETPALSAGETVDLDPVAVPPACYDPDCGFRIVVDWRNEVTEPGGEGNNEAEGRCLRF